MRFPRASEEPGFLPVYQALSERGELTAHVVAYPVVKPDLGDQQIDVVEALRAKYGAIPNLTIPGLKVFADGVVEIPSQTAALTKPYLNTGRSGQLLFTPAKMNALVTEAARRGLNVHIHAIGDSGGQSLARRLPGRARRPTLPQTCRSPSRMHNSSIPRTSRGSPSCT